MKFIKTSLITLACVAGMTAVAQNGFDAFGLPRALQMAAPVVLSGGAAFPSTNNAVDVAMFDGIVGIALSCTTNVGNGTITCTLETSSDKTNWTAVTTYAQAIPTTFTYTNRYNSTSNVVSNVILLPGTLTNPTAATSGWGTPYVVPSLFTNTAPISFSNNIVYVGLTINDQSRYLRTYWSAAGAATNASVSALLLGRAAHVP
jgi:hypothetical protein